MARSELGGSARGGGSLPSFLCYGGEGESSVERTRRRGEESGLPGGPWALNRVCNEWLGLTQTISMAQI